MQEVVLYDELQIEKKLKIDIFLDLIFSVMIIAGLRSSFIMLITAFFICVLILAIPTERVICHLLYLISFASIFKLNPSSTSIFTIIELFSVAVFIFKGKKIKFREAGGIIFLLISIIIGAVINDNFQMQYIIKLMATFLLMFFMKSLDTKTYMPSYVLMFSLGLLVASFIAYSGIAHSQIELFLKADKLFFEGASVGVRFSGLTTDSNYYSTNLCISLMMLIILSFHNIIKKKLFVYIMVVCFVFFGMQTLSKSFLLMLVVMFIYIVQMIVQNKNYKMLFIIAIVGIIFGSMLLNGKMHSASLILQRITEADNVNDLTTNRWVIWSRYLSYMFNDASVFLIGGGLGRSNFGYGSSHNAYIETFAATGLIGVCIIIYILKCFFKRYEKIKSSFENYSIALIIIIMYSFLGMLTWVDLPFHLFLCYLFFKYDFSNCKTKRVENYKSLPNIKTGEQL